MLEAVGPEMIPADLLDATLADVLRSDHDGIIVLGADGDVVFVNCRAAAMIGQPADMLVGDKLEIDIDAGGRGGTAEVRIHSVNWCGSPAALIRLHHVTAADERPSDPFEATHDPLTGLPNRFLLMDRVAQVLARAERGDSGVVLFFCALTGPDGRHAVEEPAAERLLRNVGEQIPRVVRPSDTTAYLGDGEFAIVCDHMDDRRCRVVQSRLRAAFAAARDAAGLRGATILKMGSATADSSFFDPEMLLEWARKSAE